MTPDSLFKALSDPTRRALFHRLCHEGELTVHDLTDGVAISQPAVSKHLGVLREAGLVAPEPRGREVLYRARPEGLAPLADWLADAATFWTRKVDKLDDLLKRMDQ